MSDRIESVPGKMGGMRAFIRGEVCHCGRQLYFGYDSDPTHHRGMCEDCDSVRCDAYPQDCPHPRP